MLRGLRRHHHQVRREDQALPTSARRIRVLRPVRAGEALRHSRRQVGERLRELRCSPKGRRARVLAHLRESLARRNDVHSVLRLPLKVLASLLIKCRRLRRAGVEGIAVQLAHRLRPDLLRSRKKKGTLRCLDHLRGSASRRRLRVSVSALRLAHLRLHLLEEEAVCRRPHHHAEVKLRMLRLDSVVCRLHRHREGRLTRLRMASETRRHLRLHFHHQVLDVQSRLRLRVRLLRHHSRVSADHLHHLRSRRQEQVSAAHLLHRPSHHHPQAAHRHRHQCLHAVGHQHRISRILLQHPRLVLLLRFQGEEVYWPISRRARG